jgi:hypothetical protein
LDRIQLLGADNPLAALDQMMDLMIGINVEIMKLAAPVIMENASIRATSFQATGKIPESSRGEDRAVISMHRTQEVIARLMAGKVKVRDEIDRRGQISGRRE